MAAFESLRFRMSCFPVAAVVRGLTAIILGFDGFKENTRPDRKITAGLAMMANDSDPGAGGKEYNGDQHGYYR